VACAVALSGALIAGCGGGGRSAATATASVSRVKLTVSRCGGAWRAEHGGQANIAVANGYTEAAEVYLANARTGALYDEIEGLAPGAVSTLSGTLGTGSYRLQCYTEENNAWLGPVVRVVNSDRHAALTPGLIPVTFAELVPPAKAYQAWVTSRLPVLLAQVNALATQVSSGSTTAAKASWLTAHTTYETLGAAYDAFGPLDDAINGSPPGSQSWRRDRELTGFHLIEGLLWSSAPAAKLVPAVAQLKHDVRLLIKQFATAEIAPSIIALRAHEIVENAIQFELTAHTDAGSHTNLATIAANLYGAQKTLSFVAPLLRSRYPQLGQTERALSASEHLIASYHNGSHWTPLQSLGTLARERVNASLEGLVELLAPVAAITEIRNVPRGDGIAR
jgi:iron uptake system component EfeO